MVSRLLRPFKGSRQLGEEAEREPSAGPASREYAHHRRAPADFTEADDDDDDESNSEGAEAADRYHDRRHGEEGEQEDEDGVRRSNILPLFSASHLDSLPIYSIVHAIRIIVQARTETTLTWEQLRSPQVSQFLLKPMQLQIRTQHFSKATLYALMANCLQFQKEGHLYPGNAGTSSTRAKVCELLAIKLLKEYSTRELIDALSYDYYPLQGIPGIQTPLNGRDGLGRQKPFAARTSTLEVAIRASAKHFLAHPLVVQQLEAIWNGAISFYSAADSLHRGSVAKPKPRPPAPAPGSASTGRRRSQADIRTPLLGPRGASQPVAPPTGKEDSRRSLDSVLGRRTVSLYNPRSASLFKLSRLRVPRYRQFLSTCSLAVLIGLFLAVLNQRASRISSLELVFWFWSAGFMLDELVGFNEQGFSLYIMSFWNIFDLGILLLLVIYYCTRLYGVFLVDATRWNDFAYDILAANGILLLPRIFSVLDHYQYFSQLLIAFRLMALDLAAVLVLVLISCSGFFVFFTMSRNNNDGAEVAYKIFQILMGFTPAAWEVWPTYDWLGKTLMGLFLIICHFVVVTILITVLTNSFMTIASNANQEHQFLFAINTISMVKNDALFSYIAPGNIFAWMLIPLRYCMPLRQFVGLNRFVIKLTHWPLLFCIYFYERFFLAPSMYAPTDLVENPGLGRRRAISLADPGSRTALFSPNVRVREESVVGYQKDHALEEVFRRAPDAATLRTQRRNERRKTQTAIRHWMDQHDDGFTDSPHRDFSAMHSKPSPEWQRRMSINRDRLPRRFQPMSDVRSAASDPADLVSNAPHRAFGNPHNNSARRQEVEIKDSTDADGDDELVTNEDEEDNAINTLDTRRGKQPESAVDEDYFTTPVATRFGVLAGSSLDSVIRPQGPGSPKPRRGLHSRTLSTNTILYNPPPAAQEAHEPLASSLGSQGQPPRPRSRPMSNRHTPTAIPTTADGHRSPRRSVYHHHASRPRPIMPPRDLVHTAPNRAALVGAPLALDTHARRAQRRLSSFDLLDGGQHPDLASAAGATHGHGRGHDHGNPAVDDDEVGAVASSFATQMAMATGMITPLGLRGALAAAQAQDRQALGRDSSDRMSRLVLARMKTLEEGFADVVREMKALQQQQQQFASTAHNSGNENSNNNNSGVVYKGVRGAGVAPGTLAAATIEVAGRDRSRLRRARGNGGGAGSAAARVVSEHKAENRPASRRSMREEKVGMLVDKGKGRDSRTPAEYDDTDDDTGFDDSFTKKGSSL